MEPLNREDVPELADFFEIFEQRMGFLPNSLLTMAHRPELVQAFANLGKVVYAPSESLPLQLRNMIANVASKLVPSMCVFYVLAGLIILIKNHHLIIPGFQVIFTHAFYAPESVAGGLLGGVIRAGVARGLFSNEAGLGSAAMAHGAARTGDPVREGLVAMLGPFIDTIIVCTITALVIVCTGAYQSITVKGQLTSAAFDIGLPGSGWLVAIGTILFAFTTLIAWSYYGDRAVDYLFGSRSVHVYRWIYIFFIFFGALRPLDDVINFCDALNGLMAIPNLTALIVLAPVVAQLTQDYFKRNIQRPRPPGEI